MRVFRSVLLTLLVGVFLMSLAPHIRGADMTARWFGGDGFWTNQNNWLHTPLLSNASYPSNGILTYDVEILGGTAELLWPTSFTLDKVTLGGGSLNNNGVITARDRIVWTNGNFGGNGTVIASNGVYVAGGESKESGNTFLIYGDSMLATSSFTAVWEWNNFGALEVEDGSSLIGILQNEGVIRKSASPGVANIQTLHQSGGRLDIEQGSVVMDNGRIGGRINIESNCSLKLGSSMEFTGVEITGRGRLHQVGYNSWITAFSNNVCSVDIKVDGGQFDVVGSWQLKSNATFVLNQTTLTGSGFVETSPSSTIEVIGGGFSSLGTIQITNIGTIRFIGPDSSHGSGRTLSYGYLELTNGITVDNGPGISSYLHNYGEIRKAGPGTCALKGNGIENHGLLRVDTGKLTLDTTGTNSGVFNISPNATLAVKAGTFAENTRFVGGGTNAVAIGATITGNVTNETYMRTYQDEDWIEGGIYGSGTVHINSPGTLEWSRGFLGCLIEVHPGGILAGGSGYFSPGFSKRINNRGTAYLSGNIVRHNGFFQNDGLTIVTNGCSFFEFLDHSPLLFENSGVLLITNGVFQLPQTITNRGAIHCTNATFRVPHFCNYGEATLSSTLDSAWVENRGTLRMRGSILGSLTNFGTLEIGSAFDALEVTNSVHFSENSVINLKIAGTTPATQFDQLRFREDAVLNGTLNIRFTNGFTPTLGQRFTLITWKQSHAFFSRIRGLNLGQGLRLAPIMSADGLEVVVVSAPGNVPATLNVRKSAANEFEVDWPASFQGFYLETTTNLTEPVWKVLKLTESGPIRLNLDAPQRFIRLRDPECCN